MKPVFAVPVVLLVIALALLIAGVSPLWWIVALVALAVTLVLLVVGEGVRRSPHSIADGDLRRRPVSVT
jgi:membrane protein implicated in regulation of membrane protease activity